MKKFKYKLGVALLAVTALLAIPLSACVSDGGEGNGGGGGDTPKNDPPSTPPHESVSYMETLNSQIDEMKTEVLETESDYALGRGGVAYYVSATGSADADGLSEANPISVTKLSSVNLKKGDAVLFKRGDVFRLSNTSSVSIGAASGVTYSAYGEGAKPVLCGSVKNYAEESCWESVGGNVYKCTEYVTSDVGIMLFDYTVTSANAPYELNYGIKKMVGVDGFTGYTDLEEDMQFCSVDGSLYVYCEGGNPATKWKGGIEIGGKTNIFVTPTGGKDITVDNLRFTLCGVHAIDTDHQNVTNLTVRNSVFDWLGGCQYTASGTRYGNAVQVFAGCSGYYVYNNWIYQIYDTAITHQFNKDGDCLMEDIEYSENLIEYCHWSIEYYNKGTGNCTTRNVDVHDNFLAYGGYGWGSEGRRDVSPTMAFQGKAGTNENYVIHDNTFMFTTNTFILASKQDDISLYEFYDNTYVQYEGQNFYREVKYDSNGNVLTTVDDKGVVHTAYRYFKFIEEGSEVELSAEEVLEQKINESGFKLIFVYSDGTTSKDE